VVDQQIKKLSAFCGTYVLMNNEVQKFWIFVLKTD